MRDTRGVLRLAAAVALLASACGGGDDDSAAETAAPIDTSAEQEPVTMSLWVPFSGREFEDLQPIFAGFQEKYPWITLEVTEAVEDDDQVVAAIRSGEPPDAVMSWSLDSLGQFCDSGAWQDLTPYIEQAGLDMATVFPASVSRYTSFGGSTCALPFLTDAMGLYYNADMFAEAGITEPPHTLSELRQVAEQLTVLNPDGSIAVAGFVPWFGYYEHTPLELSIVHDADWYNDDGTASAVASDPDWAAIFEWQREFVDFYGADNLATFVAGQGDEWSSANDFQQGRVAMMIDGEWRTAFIANDAPDLNYGTAPVPVPDERVDSYGSGRVGGTILGIPNGSPHPAEAWLLVEYMATDTDALVTASNSLRNVPTTFAALESTELDVTPQFQTFMDIFAHPESHYKEMTVLGSADQELVQAFAENWQAGDVSDLEAGLADLAQQIDDALRRGDRLSREQGDRRHD